MLKPREADPRGNFVDYGFVLNEAVFARRPYRSLVRTLSVQLATFELGDLGCYQGVFVREGLGQASARFLQLFQMRVQRFKDVGVVFGATQLMERCNGQCTVIAIIR